MELSDRTWDDSRILTIESFESTCLCAKRTERRISERQYGNYDKERISGSRFCRIRKIFNKIRFQSVHDRIFHV